MFLASAALVLSHLQPADTVPLYEDLGTHGYRVTTTVPLAQSYFDQGLRLYYAFNHAEAIRAFREAQRLDPACAMCFWGEAMAWGPNINASMDSISGVAAAAAIRQAVSRRDGASASERALIDAAAARYRNPPPADRAALDSAYATAMAAAVRANPGDDEMVVLHAEAMMDLRPWNYWTPTRAAQPGMEAVMRAIEGVLSRKPDHPGACHFYIHLMEAAHPEAAVPCAERLAALMPGAGHIVHMPGHIYIRVGRYMDAIRANEHAVHADESFIRDQRPDAGTYTLGYYPHNHDFLAFAAAMAGRRQQALAAADELTEIASGEAMLAPGMAFIQHHAVRRLQMRIRFARWDEILSAPRPDPRAIHATAMWHYARGRALAARGRADAAAAELAELRRLAASRALTGVRLEFNEAPRVLAVATRVLAGSIAAARSRHDAAIRELEEAVRLEGALRYGEPPEWTIPVRQELGQVYLAAGRPADAERVFREDLRTFPRNGWSLAGLVRALRAQNRQAEAAEAMDELTRAWANADVPIAELGVR